MMMRATLTTLLLLAAPSASAEWAKVAEAADTTFYVESSSVARDGSHRQASVIQDYAAQEPSGARSRQISYEIDCSRERLRSLAVTEHSGPMAQGERLGSSQQPSEWMYVAPRTGSNIASQSAYRAILRFACSR